MTPLTGAARGQLPEARVGVVAPFDFELDWELWRWVPPEVALYITRTPRVEGEVGVGFAEALGQTETLAAAVDELAMARPGVVAYACTSGSFVGGTAGDAALRGAMEAAGAGIGLRAVTASSALVEALGALGLHRIGVATPYDEPLTRRLCTYIAEAGFEVGPVANLGLAGGIARTTQASVADLAKSVDGRDVDGIFLSCTNLPTLGILEGLERDIGKPVLSANLVMIWSALGVVGARPKSAPEMLFRLT